MQSRPRLIDATRLLAENVTVPFGSDYSTDAVPSEGYDHIDFKVKIGAGGANGNTTLSAKFYDLDAFGAAPIDVEDVDLATGLAPNVQYNPTKDITGAAASACYTFRCRTNGQSVYMVLDVDVADLVVSINATRG